MSFLSLCLSFIQPALLLCAATGKILVPRVRNLNSELRSSGLQSGIWNRASVSLELSAPLTQKTWFEVKDPIVEVISVTVGA